ncbi:MAG: hypothetical protein AAB403_15305, partial [Planctomycetota bacterium]
NDADATCDNADATCNDAGATCDNTNTACDDAGTDGASDTYRTGHSGHTKTVAGIHTGRSGGLNDPGSNTHVGGGRAYYQ